jgi:hypothetical protein
VKTNQTEEQIKKATSSIAAGLRILRKLEEDGTEEEQAQRAAARQKVADILVPAIQAMETALAEVRPIRDQWGAQLARLLSLRGRVSLPGGGAGAWHQIEQAEWLINNGIDGYERHLRTAKSMLARRHPGREDIHAADGLAKEVRAVADLPTGVRYALGKIEEIMARVVDAAGPDFIEEVVSGPAKPAEPAEPTEAEKYADLTARAWRQIYGVDDDSEARKRRQRPEQTDTAFNPFKA